MCVSYFFRAGHQGLKSKPHPGNPTGEPIWWKSEEEKLLLSRDELALSGLGRARDIGEFLMDLVWAVHRKENQLRDFLDTTYGSLKRRLTIHQHTPPSEGGV